MEISVPVLVVLSLLAFVGAIAIVGVTVGHFFVRKDDELARKTDEYEKLRFKRMD